MLSPDLLLALTFWCSFYDVPPALPLAVMRMESGPMFQCGPLNKSETLIGPGGIHVDFRKKYDIDDPRENIRIVVKAFQGKKTEAQIVSRLKTYNPEWRKGNYLNDVMKTYRQYAKCRLEREYRRMGYE